MGDQRNSSNKKRERKNDKEVVIVPDRLSSLQDDALINILSRLPFDIVVDFATLSRRWLTLWTHMTCIDIKHVKFPKCDIADFWTAFHNALPKLVSSPSSIERFSLNLFHLYYSQARPCWSVIDSLTDRLRERNVQQIEVQSTGSSGQYGQLTPTTTCVFQIRSLVSLELGTSGSIPWRLPNKHDGYSINLPNLKKLSLVVDPSQHSSLEEVINSCSSLENLSFTIITRPHQYADDLPSVLDRSIRVSSLTLKRLCITLYTRFNLIIEAPELEEFTLVSHYHKPYDDDESSLLAFFDSISNVKTLKIDILFELPGNIVRTLFPNMTRLTWTLRSPNDFDVLIYLLDCPCLEVLVLDLDFCTISETCKRLIPENIIATSMLLTPVRRLELKALRYASRRDEHLLKIARYLLENAIVLEEFVLTVQYRYHTMADKFEDSQLYQALIKCPRRSPRCRIELLGA